MRVRLNSSGAAHHGAPTARASWKVYMQTMMMNNIQMVCFACRQSRHGAAHHGAPPRELHRPARPAVPAGAAALLGGGTVRAGVGWNFWGGGGLECTPCGRCRRARRARGAGARGARALQQQPLHSSWAAAGAKPPARQPYTRHTTHSPTPPHSTPPAPLCRDPLAAALPDIAAGLQRVQRAVSETQSLLNRHLSELTVLKDALHMHSYVLLGWVGGGRV